MQAVIPAAGKGTRMAPVTGGGAKELLPLDGRPILDYVIEEALAGGASHVVIVSAPDKEDLNAYLHQRHAERVTVRYQTEQLGLGDAVACAKVADDALVLLPDCLFLPASPVNELRKALENGAAVALAVEEVAKERISHYGIVETDEVGCVGRILEKPRPNETASRTAVSARYAFGKEFMVRLPKYVDDCGRARQGTDTRSEIDLSEAIQGSIDSGDRVMAIPVSRFGRRYDCGSIEGYEAASEAIRQ